MAYSDFTYPAVLTDFNLVLREARLFADVAPLNLSTEFLRRSGEGSRLAVSVNTEKARSEFVIAPLFLELRLMGYRFGLFSGVDLKADPKAGLTGVCDFVLTRSELQTVLGRPLIAVVEAKNDNLRTGYGQCVAEMVAAQLLNHREGFTETVYGLVTTGDLWQFLRLDGLNLTLDTYQYQLTESATILSVLAHLLGQDAPQKSL